MRAGAIKRAWNIWLVLPEAVRMGAILLLFALLLAWLSR